MGDNQPLALTGLGTAGRRDGLRCEGVESMAVIRRGAVNRALEMARRWPDDPVVHRRLPRPDADQLAHPAAAAAGLRAGLPADVPGDLHRRAGPPAAAGL